METEWKDGRFNMALPDDQTLLVVVLKFPGEEPIFMPITIEDVERRVLATDVEGWRQMWDEALGEKIRQRIIEHYLSRGTQ